MALTHADRASMANSIIEYMQEAYEAEGVDGDFDDGRRYLRDDASDEELRCEYEKWVPLAERFI